MLLKYGTYSFDSNAVVIGTHVETLWNEGGQAYAQQHTWDVEGWLSASGQAALTAAQEALETVLKIQRRDLILYQDDGTTESATVLKNTGSITGVKITGGPVFDSTRGSEYATERHFTFTAEAEYPVTGAAGLLLTWTETISSSGGWPTYIHRPSLNQPPQKQQLYFQEPYTATQKGTAVGYRRYPEPAAMLWPFALKRSPVFDREAPKRRGPEKFEGFAISWSYEYESATPLIGLPHTWPAKGA